MTLFKQIIIILTFFQTIILAAVMWQNFNTVNEFVQTQLGVDAKHTANSLGLSISPSIAQEDLVTVETMILSMFDSGYYENITLKDVDGKALISYNLPVIVPDVPKWFFGLFDLKAPEAVSDIMAGWSQFGTLHVRNNVGIAYRQLWNTFKDISITFIIITLLAFLILYVSLRFILKPLHVVQQQAEAIVSNDFIFQEHLPRTTELKKVVHAMNSMISKVKQIFDQEAQIVKKYHALLYEDSATKIFNRRYFMLKLQEYLQSDESSLGHVIFITLTNEEHIKPNLGYEHSKDLMLKIANEINLITAKHENSVVARMKKADFAIIVPNSNSLHVNQTCTNLAQSLKQTLSSFALNTDEYYFNFGVTPYKQEFSTTDILSKADFALANAKEQGMFKVHIDDIEQNQVLGKGAWKNEIINALDEKRFIFASQKVIDTNQDILHNEIFLRLVDKDGVVKNAAYFIPMVNELGLNEIVDKYVVENIIENIQNNSNFAMELSINLGKEILANAHTLVWFENKIKELRLKTKHKISFELPSRVKLPIDMLAGFSRLLRGYGFGFGLDNFEVNGDSLKLLQDVKLDYIKISASSLVDLLGNNDAVNSKQSLDIITNSMGTKVIAVGVQNKIEYDKLEQMGISYMQGSFIQEPYIV